MIRALSTVAVALFILFPNVDINGQVSDNSKKRISFDVDYASFRGAEGTLNLEIYLLVSRAEFDFVESEEKYAAKHHIDVQLRSNDSLIAGDSWERVDRTDDPGSILSTQLLPDFTAFNVPPGSYDLVVTYEDLNTKATGRRHLDVVINSFGENELVISELEFATTIKQVDKRGIFTKYTRDVIPNAASTYGIEIPVLYIYCEIYNFFENGEGESNNYQVEYVITDLNGVEIINKEGEVKRQRAVIFISIRTIVLVLIMVCLIYNRYRLKQRALTLLDKKNKQITDSINYAKRIQLAILPPKNVLDEYLNDSFILFKPKDIVSGDFYWVGRNNGSTLFATVDCTGHGVPGAFMSMIGNTLLNQIVHENNITKPSEILKNLHEGVMTALNQGSKEGYSGDGMDIAICNWNIEANTLEYAGAHNPLYHVRNGKITEIKGDRLFIGGPLSKSIFKNHSVDLEKGDVIYLFSDGYADQRGGPEGKKFYYEPFKQVLLDIQGKSMEEQKTHLDQTISRWMGNYDQIDDILIMGVKV